VLAGCLAAQERFWIDDPSDLVTGKHGNNLIPLGCTSGSGPLNDTRWQQLVPARVLPPLRCRLEAMSVMAAMGTLEQLYEKLQIEVAATRAEALFPELEANLPAPMTVLQLADKSVRWTTNEITRLDFASSFPHDGTSGLVFEIQKVVTPGALLNMKTTENGPAGGPQPTRFCGFAHDPDRRIVNAHPCELLVRLHFVARERFGARIVAGEPPKRVAAAQPWVRAAQKGGAEPPPLPAGARSIEAGTVGASGTWVAIRFAARAGIAPDAAPDVVVPVPIGAGGLGVVAVPLPTVGELLGTALLAQPSLTGPLGGWDRGTSLRIDR
jgi:hypothetical protein